MMNVKRIIYTMPMRLDTAKRRDEGHRDSRGAFTLIELLVVIAIIAILAAIILPVLSNAQKQGQRIGCINNLKQLGAACKMYADDNSGELVSSWPIGWGNYPVNPYCWCPGWACVNNPSGALDYGPDPQFNCTNVYALEQGAIWQYTKQAGIYHCPSDTGTMGGRPILRSYSMNSWISGRSSGDPTGDTDYTTPDQDGALTYTFFRKEGQIRQPSQLFVLIDEDASTINDGLFVVDMSTPNNVSDLPATRHKTVYQLAFADGHAQAFRWQDSPGDWVGSDPEPDCQMLQSMTTVQK